MRAVVQRVSMASVEVIENSSAEVVGEINKGLMVLLGVENGDTIDDAKWLASKVPVCRFDNDV